MARALVVFGLIAVLLGGCGDDHCLSGEASRCDGEYVQTCEGYDWVDVEDCEQSDEGPYCVIFFGDAQCSSARH